MTDEHDDIIGELIDAARSGDIAPADERLTADEMVARIMDAALGGRITKLGDGVVLMEGSAKFKRKKES